jgi:hypothetical protein
MSQPNCNGLAAVNNHPAETQFDIFSGGDINATLTQLTRAGHTVKQSTDGAYWVSKFGLSRYCESLSDLQAFARKVGVLSKFSSPTPEYVNPTEKTNLPLPRS